MDKTISANLRAQSTKIPYNVYRTCDGRQDTSKSIAQREEAVQGEMHLPTLIIATLVPVILTLLPLANDRPLRRDQEQHGAKRQYIQDNDETDRSETVENTEAIPMRSE